MWYHFTASQFMSHIHYVALWNSLQSNGYHAGYIKDNFGCTKRPCECAGFALSDKTVIGMDY